MSDHYSFITHKPLTDLTQILIGELQDLGFPPEFWFSLHTEIDLEIFSRSGMIPDQFFPVDRKFSERCFGITESSGIWNVPKFLQSYTH